MSKLKTYPVAPLVLLVGESDAIRHLTAAFDKRRDADQATAVGDGREAVEFLLGRGRHREREKAPLPTMLVFDERLPDAQKMLQTIQDEKDLRYLIPLVMTRSLQEPPKLSRVGLSMRIPSLKAEYDQVAQRIIRLLPAC